MIDLRSRRDIGTTQKKLDHTIQKNILRAKENCSNFALPFIPTALETFVRSTELVLDLVLASSKSVGMRTSLSHFQVNLMSFQAF